MNIQYLSFDISTYINNNIAYICTMFNKKDIFCCTFEGLPFLAQLLVSSSNSHSYYWLIFN